MAENNKLYLSVSAAARQSGISKSVISKAVKTPVKDGGLAARNTPKGKGKGAGYEIDKADFAVWEKKYKETRAQGKNTPKNDNEEPKRTPKNTHENTFKIKELEFDLKMERKEKEWLEKQHDAEKERSEKLEQERDDWKEQAQKLLLTHQPSVQTPPPAKKSQPLRAIMWGVGGFLLLVLVLLAAYYGRPLLVEYGVI